MPLDPGIKMMLDQTADAPVQSITEVGPVEARLMYTMMAALDGEPEPVGSVDELTIPGPACPIAARTYRAEGTGSGAPVFVWYHGGGWVIGDLDTADRTARKLANRTGAVVVSIDYRLAPEHPFPSCYDDTVGTLEWVAAHAGDLDADGARIAIGGDSAGGNLSAVAAIAARDRGLGLRHQLLVYPVTDATLSYPSMDENASGYLLERTTMQWFVEHYAGETDPKDPRISPMYADDLSGVAPATVITAEFDPLRDEGEAYAERLREAGVPVERKRYDGAIHGFFALGLITPLATEAIDFAASRVRAALA
jgi:acetyl esterase